MTDSPKLSRDGSVFILDLGDGENTIDMDWLATVAAALDQVAAADGPAALITVASGKSWSNGLDLPWVAENLDRLPAFGRSIREVYARILTLGVPTVAAVQGHAFGAGAMLAMAHDYRVMRSDRGYFCFPEVDIDVPFTPGMLDLVSAKVPTRTAARMTLTGRRYGGEEALRDGIVDEAVPLDRVRGAATVYADELSRTAGASLAGIKQGLYGKVSAELLADD